MDTPFTLHQKLLQNLKVITAVYSNLISYYTTYLDAYRNLVVLRQKLLGRFNSAVMIKVCEESHTLAFARMSYNQTVRYVKHLQMEWVHLRSQRTKIKVSERGGWYAQSFDDCISITEKFYEGLKLEFLIDSDEEHAEQPISFDDPVVQMETSLHQSAADLALIQSILKVPTVPSSSTGSLQSIVDKEAFLEFVNSAAGTVSDSEFTLRSESRDSPLMSQCKQSNNDDDYKDDDEDEEMRSITYVHKKFNHCMKL